MDKLVDFYFTRVVLTSVYYPGIIICVEREEAMEDSYTAFEGPKRLAQGALNDVVVKVKRRLTKGGSAQDVLIFSDATGKTMDFNLQGDEDEVLKRLQPFLTTEDTESKTTGPGRPKLGVISREVSLLPRHWEWLANQPSGASATLRKLVDDARFKSANATVSVKQLQERVYKVMSVLAGDLLGYEETLRALYRKDKKGFHSGLSVWPKDVRAHLEELAKPIFS